MSTELSECMLGRDFPNDQYNSVKRTIDFGKNRLKLRMCDAAYDEKELECEIAKI